MSRDLLDWIRTELARTPAVLPLVDPVLNQARQTFGGAKVYLPRRPPQQRQQVSSRTLRRHRAERACG